MPLRHRVPAHGRVGAALRVARALHELEGSGQVARLGHMLPALVRITSAGHDGNATEVVLSYKLAQWLAYCILVCSEPTRTLKVFEEIVGPERMGTALDAALVRVSGNHGRHPSVLRAERLR